MAGPKAADAVAAELYQLLQASGAAMHTMSYTQFYEVCNRSRLTRTAYDTIRDECIEAGLVIGFGWNTVMVGIDENFAPTGLGQNEL